MKIRYVGIKQDGETAFARECGFERWMTGDTHDVTDAKLAKRMLEHPDVFAEAVATDATTKTASAPAPSVTTADAKTASASRKKAPAPAPAPAPEPNSTQGITLAPGAEVKADPPAEPVRTKGASKPAAKKSAAKSSKRK